MDSASFLPFDQLPAELRTTIWQYTIPRQRVVDLIYNPGQDRYFSFNSTVPILLHVCRESRSIGLEVYDLCFGTESHPPCIPFDPVHDVLFFDNWLGDMDLYLVQVGPMRIADLTATQRIAINCEGLPDNRRHRRELVHSTVKSIATRFPNIRALYFVIEPINPYSRGIIVFHEIFDEHHYASCHICRQKLRIARATKNLRQYMPGDSTRAPDLHIMTACRGEDQTNLVGCKEMPQEEPNSLNEDEDSDFSGTESETTGEHIDNDISDTEVEDLLAEEREYVARHEIQALFPEMEKGRQYCTQKCLLGLKRGWDLDEGCPNVSSHRRGTSITRHPVNPGEFAPLVGERQRQNRYRHSEALDRWKKVGNTGVLFKVELPPYGYTFVGKGTLPWGLDRLRHESLVYSRLERLQGEVVPVHMGIVSLVPGQGYILPGGSRVAHMMLMSWGGEAADEAAAGMCASDLAAEVKRSSAAVWAEGVDYFDGRGHRNDRLWNEERGRVMLINFDGSTIHVTC